VEPVDDGVLRRVEGREVLGAESVDEGRADGGDVAGAAAWMAAKPSDVSTTSIPRPSGQSSRRSS
jgi:hypothetical protein